MNKTDITKNNLYINKIINVIKSHNDNRHKLLYIKCRHSDAFVYILSGSCRYEFDDGTGFTVSDGDILYLAHNSAYTMYINTNDYRYIFCDFEFDDKSHRKSDLYTPKNSSNTESLFNKLLQCKNTFAESMSVLYSIYGTVMLTANSKYIDNFSKSKISDAKEYIDINFKDYSIGVGMLAEMAGMSEVYFRKLFKSQYYISPSQYIISARLKNAKELMKYPFMTLEECALQSGFSSIQYFCRVFKKATGISPAKYRTEKDV